MSVSPEGSICRGSRDQRVVIRERGCRSLGILEYLLPGSASSALPVNEHYLVKCFHYRIHTGIFTVRP